MSFLQTYYTSCEAGLRSGKGFQFNAVTEGIDPATLQQVERLGLYVPPISRPSRPTPEEIEQFPFALLYQRLADGRAVIAQARYKGMDYSGRYGNYFTHALISTDPQSDIGSHSFLPIELWMSENWASEPALTTVLPARDEMQPGGQITPEDVLGFLFQCERIKYLPAFLTAVARALGGERRIVIVDDDQNVALWIAAACYALPGHLALQVTFNTYVKNPYQTDFLLVGTTSDSDFRFAPHELEYQFFVFDFPGDRFSKLAGASGFAAMATAFYEQRVAEKLADFGRFVERVEPDLRPAALDAAMACYAITTGLTPPQMNRAEVITWLANRLKAFKPEEIGEILSGVLTAKGLDRDVVEACTDLYLAARDPHTLEMVEAPYLRALIGEISASHNVEMLDAILRRLPPLDQKGQQAAAPFHQVWLKQVKDVIGPDHLRVMFNLGDKCGFLENEDEAFAAIGQDVFAQLLKDQAVRQTLFEFVNKPAFRLIVRGIGDDLAQPQKVKSPGVFRDLAEVISHPVIGPELAQYAVERRNSELYLRLFTANQASQPASHLETLQSYIDELKRWRVKSDLAQQVDDAFDVIWQGQMPSEDESLRLLEILQEEKVKGSNIPQRVASLVTSTDIRKLTPRQKRLVRALEDERLYNGLDGKTQIVLYGYFLAVYAEEKVAQGEVKPRIVQSALEFLSKNADHLIPAIQSRIYELYAICTVLVKDVEDQYELMRQGSDGYGSSFIVCCGEAIIDALGQPSDTHYKTMARWFKDRVAPEMRQRSNPKAKQPVSQIYTESFYFALEQWKEKDLVEIGKRLISAKNKDKDKDKDKDIAQLWNDWRKNRTVSLVSKIFRFFSFNRRRTYERRPGRRN